MRKFQKRTYICLSLLLYFPAWGQSAQEILNHYLDTVSNGTPEKWLQIKSVYATSISYFDAAIFQSKVINLTNHDLPSYKKMWKIWPDRQKEELYRDSLYTDLTGSFYFLRNKHIIILKGVPPIETEPKKNVWFEFYPALIQHYIKESKNITLNGIKKIPGGIAESFEVRITTQKQEHVLLFNTDTFLLEAIYLPDQDIYWVFSDYKEFNGYLIPTNHYNLKGGIIFSRQIYISFIINPPIEATLFNPPN